MSACGVPDGDDFDFFGSHLRAVDDQIIARDDPANAGKGSVAKEGADKWKRFQNLGVMKKIFSDFQSCAWIVAGNVGDDFRKVSASAKGPDQFVIHVRSSRSICS